MYVLTALDFSWFWVAIWVLFYLRFTDYAGLGLLEAIMIITMVVGEIPTGAIADLFGKTKTLRLAYLISGLGFFFIGISSTFTQVAAGVMAATLGGTLGSGTTEAFIYDSLLSVENEHSYERVLGNISTIKMITFAICSLVGGVMYSVHPGLPFIALGLTKGLAVLLSFVLVEPPIDTDTFSLKNYLLQTKAGFAQLFKSRKIQLQTSLLVLLSMIVTMNTHVLIDVQLVALGWQEKELGAIVAILFVVSALLSQLTRYVARKNGNWVGAVALALLISLSMIGIPYLGVILATATIMLRNGLILLFENASSAVINSNTESKHRATTLSTYNMMNNVPYVLSAYYLGSLMDFYSPHLVVLVLGLLLFLISSLGLVAMRKVTFSTQP